jgi:hypothetical protein
MRRSFQGITRMTWDNWDVAWKLSVGSIKNEQKKRTKKEQKKESYHRIDNWRSNHSGITSASKRSSNPQPRPSLSHSPPTLSNPILSLFPTCVRLP